MSHIHLGSRLASIAALCLINMSVLAQSVLAQSVSPTVSPTISPAISPTVPAPVPTVPPIDSQRASEPNAQPTQPTSTTSTTQAQNARPVCPENQFPSAFPDVPPEDWAYEAVNRLAIGPVRCFPRAPQS